MTNEEYNKSVQEYGLEMPNILIRRFTLEQCEDWNEYVNKCAKMLYIDFFTRRGVPYFFVKEADSILIEGNKTDEIYLSIAEHTGNLLMSLLRVREKFARYCERVEELKENQDTLDAILAEVEKDLNEELDKAEEEPKAEVQKQEDSTVVLKSLLEAVHNGVKKLEEILTLTTGRKVEEEK